MARPLTRAQQLENAAFLAQLRRTGNAREAARAIGAHRATFTRRRAKHPAFATAWDAALALAHATLKSPLPLASSGSTAPRAVEDVPGAHPTPNWAGGGQCGNDPEPRILRTRSGRLQLRRAQAQRLTRAAEQAFLAALSATANVRLSAAAAGFSHSAFYHRRRQHAGFAREMRLALQMGYERLEMALLESTLVDAHADDAWRHNDPPPIPQMSASEALQLLYLHQKEARLWSEPDHIKRRKGESPEAWSYRLGAMHEARLQRDREAFDLAEAARRSAGAGGVSPHEPPPPLLPALDQVTGWSKASGGPPHHAGVALFGGWRLGDIPKGS